jgi:ubiquinone/menaquinone biosynthesis C-methylase UbiE
VKNILPFKTGMTALDIGAGIGKSMISLQNAGFDAFDFEPAKPFYDRTVLRVNLSPEK